MFMNDITLFYLIDKVLLQAILNLSLILFVEPFWKCYVSVQFFLLGLNQVLVFIQKLNKMENYEICLWNHKWEMYGKWQRDLSAAFCRGRSYYSQPDRDKSEKTMRERERCRERYKGLIVFCCGCKSQQNTISPCIRWTRRVPLSKRKLIWLVKALSDVSSLSAQETNKAI